MNSGKTMQIIRENEEGLERGRKKYDCVGSSVIQIPIIPKKYIVENADWLITFQVVQ